MVFDHTVPHIESLLAAINSQKNGINSNYTLKYFLDSDLSDNLKHDINNSLIQWKRFVEGIVSVNTASFEFILEQVEDNKDAIFSFLSSEKNDPESDGLVVTYLSLIHISEPTRPY